MNNNSIGWLSKSNTILWQGDCLELMKNIADQSVHMILTDPPYNIKKADWDKWKTKESYIDWCSKWILECQRVLKDNGSFYFFHNDMPQIAMLMEWIRQNTRFVYNSFIIWDKGDFRALSWKNPSEKNKLRCWFPTCEYILFYTFQDKTGLTTVMLDSNNFPTLRGYFKEYQEALGLNKKQIIEKVGQRADHCFRWGSSQWDLPTKETYEELGKLPISNKFLRREYEGLRREKNEFMRREYEDLRREYEDLRYTFNLQGNDKNIIRCINRNNGRNHPTQKPIDLMENIIKHSSNEGDTILDPFMGSGTTIVAAARLGRSAIGIELDETYYKIAVDRAKKFEKEELWQE